MESRRDMMAQTLSAIAIAPLTIPPFLSAGQVEENKAITVAALAMLIIGYRLIGYKKAYTENPTLKNGGLQKYDVWSVYNVKEDRYEWGLETKIEMDWGRKHINCDVGKDFNHRWASSIDVPRKSFQHNRQEVIDFLLPVWNEYANGNLEMKITWDDINVWIELADIV